MKVYSDQAVSKEDLDLRLSQLKNVDLAEIDKKQTRQIKVLEVWLIALTVVNFGTLTALFTILYNI